MLFPEGDPFKSASAGQSHTEEDLPFKTNIMGEVIRTVVCGTLRRAALYDVFLK